MKSKKCVHPYPERGEKIPNTSNPGRRTKPGKKQKSLLFASLSEIRPHLLDSTEQRIRGRKVFHEQRGNLTHREVAHRKRSEEDASRPVLRWEVRGEANWPLPTNKTDRGLFLRIRERGWKREKARVMAWSRTGITCCLLRAISVQSKEKCLQRPN